MVMLERHVVTQMWELKWNNRPLGGAACDYRGCQEGCPETLGDCEELVVQDRHQDGQEVMAFCNTHRSFAVDAPPRTLSKK